ncbi:hypothetical protein Pcinc_038471 [Petrolisthes cinctipes]|uniref:Uncharacterized protein n=1 Tax=Petrolisthes cinctipes TaxID=88211 RepID=A0AAE1BQX6_PETCI|nr:hypothetical protein Pcinc_038471 [Petrolisthes cinctipes]
MLAAWKWTDGKKSCVRQNLEEADPVLSEMDPREDLEVDDPNQVEEEASGGYKVIASSVVGRPGVSSVVALTSTTVW